MIYELKTMAIWIRSASFTVHSCDLVFVSDNAALIGNGYAYFGQLVQNNTLAGQATFETWIESPVNEIFFLVGYAFQEIFALLHINMAGGTGTYAAAVVIQVYVAFFCDFQNGHILEISGHRFGRNSLIFKVELNGGHV